MRNRCSSWPCDKNNAGYDFSATKRGCSGYPDWYITIRVAVPGKEKIWPGMGLIIYSDEVIDELRRDFLPAEFRDVFFGTVNKVTARHRSLLAKILPSWR
jgi:hypothetical protein